MKGYNANDYEIWPNGTVYFIIDFNFHRLSTGVYNARLVYTPNKTIKISNYFNYFNIFIYTGQVLLLFLTCHYY